MYLSAPGAKTALINGQVVDPDKETVAAGGVLIEGAVISATGAEVTAANAGSDAEIIDCRGQTISPGLIDMRAFLGEPGAGHRETIATASAAAAHGGVTTILAMPDTNPPVDGSAAVQFVLQRARETACVRVLPSAGLTKGLAGAELAEFGLLQEAGAAAFSNGLQSVRSSQVMRRALTYARDFDALVVHQCEDPDLGKPGVMNEGELATRLGLAGVPREAETIVLDRDMRLVAMTGARYHAAMVTNVLSLDVIAKAKAAGLPVTCGVSINHLTLNEADIGDYRTFLKVSPPLRTEDERMALVEALASGLIDVVVSDHNPQDVEMKNVPFAEAEFGAIGLETMLAAGLRLVHAGQISLPKLVAAMALRPAQILRLPQGRLASGAPADVIVFDPDEPFVVDPAELHSRSLNTPFDEARLQGRVRLTMVGGRIVLRDGVLV
ncbi:MAG: dihydroorotase [Hyphomicrobiales bacterium]|nr:dihydroorotase [Hyphomicrobiales bacterium]